MEKDRRAIRIERDNKTERERKREKEREREREREIQKNIKAHSIFLFE